MASVDETLTERGSRYGNFTDNARVSQLMKTVVHAEWNAQEICPPAVIIEAMDMILHKIGRIACGDPLYTDSWHDIAGYATLVEQRLQPQEVPPHGRPVQEQPQPGVNWPSQPDRQQHDEGQRDKRPPTVDIRRRPPVHHPNIDG